MLVFDNPLPQYIPYSNPEEFETYTPSVTSALSIRFSTVDLSTM